MPYFSATFVDSDLNDPATVAACERLLDLAPHLGIDPVALARVRRRLVAHEREREGMLPCRRQEDLDRLIAQDIQTLCSAILKLQAAVDRMPSA